MEAQETQVTLWAGLMSPLALDLGPPGCGVVLDIQESPEAIPTLRSGPVEHSIVHSR